MWKVRAPQGLKGFMWLVMNQALLTNNAQFRRGIVVNNLSPICDIYSEITLHALGDYFKAKEMWLSIGHSFINNSFFQQAIQNWLEENPLDETRTFKGWTGA